MALPVPAGASLGPGAAAALAMGPDAPAGGERWLRSGGRAFFGSRRCGANCITERRKAEKGGPAAVVAQRLIRVVHYSAGRVRSYGQGRAAPRRATRP